MLSPFFDRMNNFCSLCNISIFKILFLSKKKDFFFGLNFYLSYIHLSYFILYKKMTDFAKEIKRLQKLSCILLSPEEEKKFWTQLTDIIGFLGKLPETKEIVSTKEMKNKLTLRTIEGVSQCVDSNKIMKNVKHPIVNNSIVIKSVLN